ncbi:GNAT family N-acetyltransferase [Candidatus Leptofilum sp.]|uniref:GNAT family N-acetyltransferase n=1 Tax=Candidatus Leptofilum sp. TaxID=3241576 RepID=UPI003B5AE194
MFKTPRLTVRKATVADAGMFYALWSDPAVMTYVGFPNGLGMTQQEIEGKLQNQGEGVYGRLLTIILCKTGEPIGECYMTWPNQAGIAETDVKLLPTFWGQKFGVEVKRGLLDYLFTHTDCTAVQATPNIHNIASIKMQEAVGGVRAGTGKSLVPQPNRIESVTVEYVFYRVYRRIWQKNNSLQTTLVDGKRPLPNTHLLDVQMHNPKKANVIIVGASAAGLAVGACLKQQGVPSVTILERANKVGAAWRTHYDRLHLHTDKRNSNLPHYAFPPDVPRYPSRQQLITYLENYAEHFGLQPHFGQEATKIEQEDGLWHVTTASEHQFAAPSLVMATGYTNQPYVPSWPGQDQFAGETLHSSAYKNGAAFANKDVLVVGFGNSGGEIAIDLHEHGAKPTIAVRSPVNVVPRDLAGIPILSVGILLSIFPPAVADLLAAPLLKLTVGDLSKYGLKKLPYGPNSQIARDGRIPLLDIGTIKLIKQGAIQVMPGIQQFHADGVTFADGQTRQFDAVVFATGYQPNLEKFGEGIGNALDDAGRPFRSGEESKSRLPGLYFCGFYVSPTGMLREIGLEAQKIAKSIAAAQGD